MMKFAKLLKYTQRVNTQKNYNKWNILAELWIYVAERDKDKQPFNVSYRIENAFKEKKKKYVKYRISIHMK